MINLRERTTPRNLLVAALRAGFVGGLASSPLAAAHTADATSIPREAQRLAQHLRQEITATVARNVQQALEPFGLRPAATAPAAAALAPPSHLALGGVTCRAGTLSWFAPPEAEDVAFWDIYHDGQLLFSVPGSRREAQLELVPGATWGLYVNARGAAGQVSQASTTLTVTPPQCAVGTAAPSAPGVLRLRGVGTEVRLNWAASRDDTAVTNYDILRNGSRVGSVAGTVSFAPETTFLDSALRPATPYSYRVVARDGEGNASPPSAAQTLRTGADCVTRICSIAPLAVETDIPWGLAPLPDGNLMYARRDAHDLVQLNPRTGQKIALGKVPNVVGTDGEGGLLGIAVFADFAASPWVYIMHTSPIDNRVVRMRLGEDRRLLPQSHQPLLTGIGRNKFHNGGRLRAGPDRCLYVATGDAQVDAAAQDIESLNGKVLRLHQNGSAPADNPFGNLVWTLGHRNPQGLAFDAQGRLWEQEFGNNIFDETNLLRRGGNYGWPDCEGTASRAGRGCATPGFIAPAQTYPTYLGSCSGIAVVKDHLFVACQRGQRLYSLQIDGGRLVDRQAHFAGTYGRLRTVEPTVDGRGLYLSTSREGDKDSLPNNSNETLYEVQVEQA